jgi:large subunit ribosomal protein L13
MLPRGPLGKHRFANLRVYAGPDHPHAAQQPEKLDLAKMSPKNTNYRNAKAS